MLADDEVGNLVAYGSLTVVARSVQESVYITQYNSDFISNKDGEGWQPQLKGVSLPSSHPSYSSTYFVYRNVPHFQRKHQVTLIYIIDVPPAHLCIKRKRA